MLFLSRDLMRLKPAFSMGIFALKFKYCLLVLAVIALQAVAVYNGYQDTVSAMEAGRSWAAYGLLYGFFFFMSGWVAMALISKLSYAAVILRNVRKRDPLF